MDVMIACPLMLPDEPLPLPQMEERVHAWGLVIQQPALALAWERQAPLRASGRCPTCRGSDLRPAGSNPRTVETSFGPAQLPRQRVRCRGCGRHAQPDDAVLAPCLGRRQCRPALRELAAMCGASWR